MPFLGQDWRSPGWSWIKTEDGWKRCDPCSHELRSEDSQYTINHSIILNSGEEEIFNNECEYAPCLVVEGLGTPLHMLNNILYRFSDGWDIVTLGQVTPTLYMLSEDRRLWKRLCQYHFAEQQFCRHLILSEKGHIEWKLMYFTLQKYYPTKEQYGDTLHFCRHCSILFWKDYHLAWLLKDSGTSTSGSAAWRPSSAGSSSCRTSR